MPFRYVACLASVAVLLLGTAAPSSARREGAANAAGAVPAFSNITTTAGIGFTHTGPGVQDKFQGTGAAWIDYDRDGDLDLYLTRRIGDNVFYRNNGDGSFTDITAQLYLADAAHDGAGIAVADYDNDGWPDIYLANSDEDVLWRNGGGVRFYNVTVAAGLNAGDARGTTASWADFNGDGWLDLYVANHEHLDKIEGMQRDQLFRSNCDGTFTEVSDFLPPGQRDGYGFAGAWTDYDDDGDLDIFLVNDCPLGPLPERLFRNDGPGGPGWIFTDVSDEMNVTRCAAGMGIAIGDYNRDGLFDYFYTNIGTPHLLRNDGDKFNLVTAQAGLDVSIAESGRYRWSWGANFFDYDLDGWEDLYIASGEFRSVSTVAPQANLLMRNNGDGTFSGLGDANGANDIDRSRTSVVGDCDGDGDLDLVVVNYEEPARLYRNDYAGGNHWLEVTLEGTSSNRDGIGSRVRIRTADGAFQYRESRSGSSLGGGDALMLHFGTAGYAQVEDMLIRWPSGIVQQLTGIACDERIHVVEPAASDAAEVASFAATTTGGVTVAVWRTDYEVRTEAFRLERLDGADAVAIDSLTGGGTTMRPHTYKSDLGALSPGLYTFRLMQVRDDGSEDVAGQVTVRVPQTIFVTAGPNPFSAATAFTVEVERTQHVSVGVYDAAGRRVAVLLDRVVTAGDRVTVPFDGESFAAGVYFARATGADFQQSRKITLVR